MSPGGPARVRLIFENGDITHVEADDRPRAAGCHIVPTRWQGSWCDYREVNGCRIPTRASWLLRRLARILLLWFSHTLFGTGFSHTARCAKDWMIAGTGGVDGSATLTCSRRAIIASVRLPKAAAVSR